jgi:hypothetical protein
VAKTPDKPSTKTNYLTRAVLMETDRFFSDPEWYFNFMGRTLTQEEEFSKWFEGEIGHLLLLMHACSSGQIGQFPLMIRDLDRMFRRALLIGLYLGGRRFGREMGADVKSPAEADDGSTAIIGEVSEEDFKEAEPTES